jgi:serine/threonine protein kinase
VTTVTFCCWTTAFTVLRVHDVYDATKKDNTISTVTELCTGSHLDSSIPYPEPRAKKIVAQILDALQYMHQRGLFHNSLTTENSTYQCVSVDFFYSHCEDLLMHLILTPFVPSL